MKLVIALKIADLGPLSSEDTLAAMQGVSSAAEHLQCGLDGSNYNSAMQAKPLEQLSEPQDLTPPPLFVTLLRHRPSVPRAKGPLDVLFSVSNSHFFSS